MKQTLQTHRKLAAWVAVTAAMLAGSLALIAVSIHQSVVDQRHTDRVVCRAITRFDTVVVETLKRSARNLPHLAYFQQHPKELRAQLSEMRRQIRLFTPPHCN